MNDSLKNEILQQFKGFMEENEILRKEVSSLKELFHVEKHSQISFENNYSPFSGDEAVVQSLMGMLERKLAPLHYLDH